MPILLSDVEFFEGILGGLGWVLSHYYFKKSQQGNPLIIGIVTWMILWFTRKIGMRIYREWRENRLDEDDGIKIYNFTNLSDNRFKVLVFVLLYLLAIGYCYSKLSDNKFPSSLNRNDITLISIISFLILYIYLRE